MDADGPDPESTEPKVVPPAGAEPDLERIAADLAAVESALERLEAGSYWNDEITGEPLPDDLLADDPTARRVAYRSEEPSPSDDVPDDDTDPADHTSASDESPDQGPPDL